MKRLALLLALAGGPAIAADFSDAPGGVLRWLDKLTGQTGDMELAVGQSASNGRLRIQLDSCRYPTSNPAADAEAHLTVMDATMAEPVFTGWMIASSPALSAMDHPRYDVWVLRCVVPGYKPLEAEATPEEESTDAAPAE
jgi:hypothetical protein